MISASVGIYKSSISTVCLFEKEYKINVYGSLCETGRVRDAVDYLECDDCLMIECVDETFDGEWHYEY